MQFISRNLSNIAAAMLSLVVGMTSVAVIGQTAVAGKAHKSEFKTHNREFCSNNDWNSEDNVSSRDLREMTLPANGDVNVDGNQNGGVSVRGEDRNDVLVRACVQAWGKSEAEAKTVVDGVKINTSGTIKADNPNDKHWSVSYDIRVPRNTNLNLTAHNGGIVVNDVSGTLNFETTNGGIMLSGLSGSVKGETTNGGVFVTLAGKSWNGSGLDVKTTNGGVRLIMAQDYAASIDTGTVNGGYSSDIPALAITTEDVKGDYYRPRNKRIQTNINGGGSPIKVTTTNGGVRISTIDDDKD